jgi:hypothetical protein
VDVLAACTAFLENPTFVSSQHTISSPVNVNNFRLSLDAIDQPRPCITKANMANLSSLVTEFTFMQLLCQIEAHDPSFPVARSATRHRECVPELIANLHCAIRPGRNETMVNLTCSLRDQAGDQCPEVHRISRSLPGHQQLISSAGREETKTMVERETIENAKDLHLNSHTKKDTLITKRRDLTKGNKKLCPNVGTTVAGNVKMKDKNRTLLEQNE